MKVTKNLLSIPPYLSTPWTNVASLRLETTETGPLLAVSLVDGSHARVPGLSQENVEQIFRCHEEFLEEEGKYAEGGDPLSQIFGQGGPALFGSEMGGQMISFPLQFGPEGLGGMGGMMAHDPSQAEAPDLPQDVLEKVAGVSQMFGVESSAVPEAQTGCNCPHCQVSRAIKGEAREEVVEEEVTDEDLRFRTWDIEEAGDKLYLVRNPLDSNEEYRVFLGDPVGCTCGTDKCEHIQAVLRS